MSTSAPQDVRARVTLVLAAATDGGASLEAAVQRVGASWRDRVGPDGAVRLGVRAGDDPLAAMMGERGALEPVDAVIEVTAPDGVAATDAARLVEGARDDLGAAVHAARSVVIAGRCYRFLSGDGNLFIALAGRRDPAISPAELTEWWLRHGPFALGLVDPLPLAYEQLHAEPEASAAAATATGFPDRGYDMYDTIAVESLADLQGSVMNPEVAAALFEDELGHVDHSSLRGALQRDVAV